MSNEINAIRRTIIIIGILLSVLIASFIARNIIVGAPLIKLPTATPLSGQISQTLINGTSGNKVISPNNFNLSNIQYFDNGAWVVVKYVALKQQSNNGFVLMQKAGPFYIDVLGPGTAFPNNIQQGIPPEVYNYLQTKGLIL